MRTIRNVSNIQSRLSRDFLQTLKFYQLIKHQYYQNYARRSIVTFCVYRKHIDPQIPQVPRLLVWPFSLKINTYGSAVFMWNDLKVNSICGRKQGNVDLIAVEMPGVVVYFMYKPTNDPRVLPALDDRNLPHIIIGDFHRHSTTWRYATTEDDGKAVISGKIIHNAKLQKSFNSTRWKKGYNPDLIFVSSCKHCKHVWEVCTGSNTSYTTPADMCKKYTI